MTIISSKVIQELKKDRDTHFVGKAQTQSSPCRISICFQVKVTSNNLFRSEDEDLRMDGKASEVSSIG
jgi:hypothetical protein